MAGGYGTDSFRNIYNTAFVTLLSRVCVHVRARLHFKSLSDSIARRTFFFFFLNSLQRNQDTDTVCAVTRK